MAEIVSETSNAVMSGTDAALGGTMRTVEEFIGDRGSEPDGDTAPPPRALDGVLARIRAKDGGAAVPPPTSDPAPDDAPADDAPADDDQAAADPPADDAAKPDDPPKDTPAADAPDVAAMRADLEARTAELAQARQIIATGRSRRATAEERGAYIKDQVATLREVIAHRIGTKPDHEEVDKELDHLLHELTIRKIGDTNLADDRKAQRAREHSDRRWRLDQQAQAADREAAEEGERTTRAVKYLASMYDGAKAEYPFLALASESEGREVAQIVHDVYLGAIEQGLIRLDTPHSEQAKEALRLTNRIYANRADRIRPHVTAPAVVPPTQQPVGKPGNAGAPTPAPSKAPVKPGTAQPRNLSAREAAASAPAARPANAAPPSRTIVELDPNDRAARESRARDIARKRFGQKPQ